MEQFILILIIVIFVLIYGIYSTKKENKGLKKQILEKLSKSYHEKIATDVYTLKCLEEYIQDKKTIKFELDDCLNKIKSVENENVFLIKTLEKKDALYQSLQHKTDESVSKITSLYSDFLLLQYDITSAYLRTKKRPALVQANKIDDLKKESKYFKEQYKQMLYKYEYLLQLFPELVNYVDSFETIQQLENTESLNEFNENFDRVQLFISKEEYLKLSIDERNQLALDKYVKSQKAIGKLVVITNYSVANYTKIMAGKLTISEWKKSLKI